MTCFKKRRRMSYTYYLRDMLYIHTWRKMLILKISVLFVCVFFVIIFSILSPILSYNKNKDIKPNSTRQTELKYILIWPQLNERHRYLNGQQEFITQNCSHTNCFLSYNKLLLEDVRNFDAVVFDVTTLRSVKNTNILRDRRQKYIFKSVEANRIPVCDTKYDDFFNWTWTYRLSSDIPHPFFDIFALDHTIVGPSNNIKWIQPMIRETNSLDILKKTKDVAWLSQKTKCDSVNVNFIKELKQELKGYNKTVDVFGPCGFKICPNKRIAECYGMLSKDYHFSVVLEDYNDVDFVTGKVVRAMNSNTIPLVKSGANLTRFLPPGSYINVQSFDIKKIGAIINHLIRNQNAYTYFFDWQNHYVLKEKPRNYVCDLCAKMNHESFDNFKSYKYFRHLWDRDYRKSCSKSKSNR